MATQVTRSLKEINAEVVKLNGNIKSVTNQNKQLDRSLKLDPSSTVLLAQKTENLQKQVSLATQKVKALKDAQLQMQIQVQNGQATQEEYKKLTIEVAKAEAQVKSFSAQVRQANNQSLTNIQNSLKGVSRAATVALGALVALGANYAKTGDEISNASKKYNISSEQYQRGAFLFDRTTGNADSYARALQDVQKQMSALARGSTKAVSAFEAIGISVEELSGKDASTVLDLIRERLGAIVDEDDRLTLANALLTSSGYDVAQMAALSAEEIAELNAQLEQNGIMSQEQVENAAALKDKWDDFKASLPSVILELSDSLIPAFEALIEIARAVLPIIVFITSVFTSMPAPLQKIVVILLILLVALPKLIAIFKALNVVMGILRVAAMTNPFILIAAAVALLILLLVQLANALGGIFGKSYSLDVDTSSLGVDMTSLSQQAGASSQSSTGSVSNNTTNYYDYSTTSVEAHTDADIDDIAAQLSTKIKVGGGK